MAQPVIDTAALLTQVTRAKGLAASAVTLLKGIPKLVADALAADDALDQVTVDAANTAIAAVVADLTSSNTDLEAALGTNPDPAPPVPVP